MIDRTVRDLAYGLRSLRRSPAVLLVAFGSLGVGIGGSIAIFSLVDAVALRPLSGVANPAELVSISSEGLSYPAYRDFAEASPGLVGFAAYAPRRLRLESESGITTVETEAVSTNFFEVLGVQPLLGRGFVSEDNQPGAPPVAILSHSYWQSTLGGDESVLGSTLRVDGGLVTVVGVAPPRFRGPLVTLTPAFWLPLRAWKEVAGPEYDDLALDNRGWSWLYTIGRLAPGASLEMVWT